MKCLESLFFWKNRRVEKLKEIIKIESKTEEETIEIESKKEPFPCKNCLVQPSCKQLCDKIEKDNDRIYDIMKKGGGCPDCGCSEVYEGPSGGMCTNIYCCRCGHGFNISPFNVERIGIRT